jgi:geranylgeranyl pyrophosphate synthase
VRLATRTPFEEVLSTAGERTRLLMERVEGRLAELTGDYGAQLERFAGGTLAAGGKRLRPLLVFICGNRGDEHASSEDPLVRAAAAIELVHMATLVHDDVIDGAMVRRGHPTVYAAYGRSAATASGDFLFSRAFSTLSLNGDGEQVRTLSAACLDLARGELAQRQDTYARGVDVDRYLYRCELKTASLFTAACRLGALAAALDRARVDGLGRFGRHAGLAFQLLDDVLDVAGSAVETGKSRGTDLLEGTTTLPLILASKADPELAKLDLRTVDTRQRAEWVCERITATDALDEARGRASELAAAAKAELNPGLPAAVRDPLVLVADRIVDRRG